MARYNLYNLCVESEYVLPCQESYMKNPVDLLIRGSKTSTEFPFIDFIGKTENGYVRSYDVGDSLLLCCDKKEKIHVLKNGSEIVIDTRKDYDNEAILITLGIGLSLSLLFRGYITLHAASMQYMDKTFGVMADSGVGKSTFLNYMIEQGAKFITDDVLAVRKLDDKITVFPSFIPMKITDKQLYQYGPELIKQKVSPKIDKYWVEVNDFKREYLPRQLDALFILKPRSNISIIDSPITIKKLNIGDSMSQLLYNTHSVWSLPKRALSTILPLHITIAKQIPVYVIEYIKRMNELPKIKESITNLILEGFTP